MNTANANAPIEVEPVTLPVPEELSIEEPAAEPDLVPSEPART